MTEDEEEEEDGAGKDEGLFTVVESYEAREVMERRERQRRCKETTDPEQEAVNATMGMSFVCRVCGEIHYPEKPPPTTTRTRSGKKRYTSRPIPSGCEGMIPRAESMSVYGGSEFAMTTGTSVFTPHGAREFKTAPTENEDKCKALANLDGYIDKMRESYRTIRQRVIQSLVRMPFAMEPKAARIKMAKVEAICKHAKSEVSSVRIGNEDISIENIKDRMFPIISVLRTGASSVALLDLTDDFKMALLHVASRMTIDGGRKNEKYVYTEMRRKVESDPRMEIFHEHYLLINTNLINRDCEVYEVPETVTTINEALRLKEDGEARKVR